MDATIKSKESPTAVFIFYSSDEQPELLDLYRDAITYLKEADVTAEVIDVAAEVEEEHTRAREYGVVSTPTVIVERDGETHRYVGVLDGLKEALEHDLYGKTVLHRIGFKRGRELAQEHGLRDADESEISQILEQLAAGADDTVALDEFDPDAHRAVVTLRPSGGGKPSPGNDGSDEDGETGSGHEDLASLLGGFFTEVFDASVAAVETECALQGADICRFDVTVPDEEKQ